MAFKKDSKSNDHITSNSFWEPKKYMQTVKRVSNGLKVCNDYCMLIQERADIERNYASNLKSWASKLSTYSDNGMEFGSMSNFVNGLKNEAEQLHSVHMATSKRLIDPLQATIKYWQKDNYHKSTIHTTVKEVKALEGEFEAAQKQWYKWYKSVNQCKKEYHLACKTVRSCQVQVENAKNDPTGTPEQELQAADRLKKIQEKLRKAEITEIKNEAAYRQALSALENENPRYISDMTEVFNKAQEFEKKRIEFFKFQATTMQEILDLSQKKEIPSIYAQLQKTISNINADSDLKLWSLTHGVDTATNFPQFEKYSPELQSLSNKQKHKMPDGNNGVTLTGVTSVLAPDSPQNPQKQGDASPRISYSSSNLSNGHVDSADKIPNQMVDDGKPGVRVRALYDYEGAEDDELSFVSSEIFEKLEDEDEQGWCKGRKDGRVGLYPANYAEVV